MGQPTGSVGVGGAPAPPPPLWGPPPLKRVAARYSGRGGTTAARHSGVRLKPGFLFGSALCYALPVWMGNATRGNRAVLALLRLQRRVAVPRR